MYRLMACCDIAGLDSHAALAVVKHLIALTNSGHSVACSIHQPRQEIFASFDKILLMSEGRQVCNLASDH